MNTLASKQRITRFRAIQMVLGGLSGGIVSFTFVTWLRHLGLNFRALPLIDLCGFVLGVAFAGCGLLVFALSFSARLSGQQLEQDPFAPPASRREMGYVRMQGAVLFLAGILLMIPLLAVMTGWARQNAWLIYAAVVAGFLLQTALNIQVWRKSDEFVRALVSQTSTITFWILQGALFLVAAGEKLGLLPEFPLWNACVVLLGFYFVTGIVIAARCARLSA